MASANLSVPELALKTNQDQTGVRLVWFFGQVKDGLGRPADTGVTVTAKARGAGCSGTGKTTDLYWEPQYAGQQTFGVRGFYLIGVDASAGCADTTLQFDVYAGSTSVRPAQPRIFTPNYGRAVRANLRLP